MEGDLTLAPEYTEEKELRPFFDVPDLWPFTLKESLSTVQGIDFANPDD